MIQVLKNQEIIILKIKIKETSLNNNLAKIDLNRTILPIIEFAYG